MVTRQINAKHLQSVLWARKAAPDVRWCAMSNTVDSYGCSRRMAPDYRIKVPPLFLVMSRISHSLVKQVRSRGHKEVRKTWGVGIRALLAEISTPPKA